MMLRHDEVTFTLTGGGTGCPRAHPLMPLKLIQRAIDGAVQRSLVSKQTVPPAGYVRSKKIYPHDEVCHTLRNDLPTLAPEEAGEFLDENLFERSFRLKIVTQPVQQVFKFGLRFILQHNYSRP